MRGSKGRKEGIDNGKYFYVIDSFFNIYGGGSASRSVDDCAGGIAKSCTILMRPFLRSFDKGKVRGSAEPTDTTAVESMRRKSLHIWV